MHYAHQHGKAPDGGPLPDPPPYPLPEHAQPPYVGDAPTAAQANDFRARFHRPLVAPSPFRAADTSTAAQAQAQAPRRPRARAR